MSNKYTYAWVPLRGDKDQFYVTYSIPKELTPADSLEHARRELSKHPLGGIVQRVDADGYAEYSFVSTWVPRVVNDLIQEIDEIISHTEYQEDE